MSNSESSTISADFPFEKKYAQVLGSRMAYVDENSTAKTVAVFLHGNPTSSYLWRNIIPAVAKHSRCIAPDLIGFGDSDKVPTLTYRFTDHQRYLEAFLDAVVPDTKIVLVVHDWGSALGFDWARRHEDRVAGLVFMEFISPSDSWDQYGEAFNYFFPQFRQPDVGRKLLIEDNVFVEQMLPGGVVRQLSEAEMTEYRRPFLQKESREPVYRFPNEIPIEGQPADVWDIAQKYIAWLVASEVPKLFFWTPNGIFVPEKRALGYIERLKNTRTIRLEVGSHYLQEDHPETISQEIADWIPKFAGKL